MTIIQDQDPMEQANDLSGVLVTVIKEFHKKNKVDITILLAALSMASVNLAYSQSVDGHELDAIKYHRKFFNTLCDEISESIAEGKL